MPRYLFKVSYTTSGIAGVLEEGGSSRREVAGQLVASVGGTMESFHFAFGAVDAYVTAELPDAAAAASVAMRVSAEGVAGVETVALLDPSEIDDAAAKARDAEYRAPGA